MIFNHKNYQVLISSICNLNYLVETFLAIYFL